MSRLSSRNLLNFHVSVFLTCLLISDLIQSIAGIGQVKWAREKQIYDGKACVIQGDL